MSKSLAEMSKIKLEATKYLISTFQDLADLKELKNWVDEEWKDHKKIWEYAFRLKIYSIETDQRPLFDKWERDNKNSFLGWKSLNELKAKLHIKICVFCGIAFTSPQKNRLYCGNLCKQRAFQEKKRKKELSIDRKT